MLYSLLKCMLRYKLQKSDLLPPWKCPPQLLLWLKHILQHCSASIQNFLIQNNLGQSDQTSHNYSSSNNLLPDGQPYHIYNNLVYHYNHPDVVSYTYCKVVIVYNSSKLACLIQSDLTDLDYLAHSSSYYQYYSGIFHLAHSTYLEHYWNPTFPPPHLFHIVDHCHRHIKFRPYYYQTFL